MLKNNERKQQSTNKITILLQWGRMGKSYKLCQMVAEAINNSKKVALYTFAHVNRIRQAKRIEEFSGKDFLFNSSVHASIPYDNEALRNADVIYIDEVGMFPSDSMIDMYISEHWISEKDMVMTADIHQIQNSNFLYLLVMEALKVGGKDALTAYNRYAEWSQLIITEKQVKNYKRVYKNTDFEIIYPKTENYNPPRQNLDLWEKEGDKPFLNKITLEDAINNGHQILVLTTATRDYVIDRFNPNWAHNINVGDVIFCKANEQVNNKMNRKYFNGEYYQIIDRTQVGYLVTNANVGNGNKIYISFAALLTDFQPKFCFCVQKGQGTDFENVTLYIRESDCGAINKQVMYTAVSRAREQYNIVIESNEDYILEKAKFVKPFGNQHISVSRSHSLSIIHSWCNANKEFIDACRTKKQVYDEFLKHQILDVYEGSYEKSLRQFRRDFELLYPNRIQSNSVINTNVSSEIKLSERSKQVALNVTRGSVKMLLSDIKNYNIAQRTKTLLKILSANGLNKVKEMNTDKTDNSIYKDDRNVDFSLTNNVNINYETFLQMLRNFNYDKNMVDRKVSGTTEDLLKFLNYRLGNGDCWHTFFWSFGLSISKIDACINFIEAWLLAIHYLYYNSILYADKKDWFTSEIANKTDSYIDSLRRSINRDNYTETGIKKSNSNTFRQRTEYEVAKTYKGNISGRFSPQYNKGATISVDKDWMTTVPNSNIYAFNLYNTDYIVIDIDGGDELTDIQSSIIRDLVEIKYCQFFKTTSPTSKHKTGGHIWVNVGNKRMRTQHPKGKHIDILGNATSSNVWIKPNKYPKGFNPNTDLQVTPIISYEELQKIRTKYQLI